MDDLVDAVDRIASETNFSGVVRVDVGDQVVLAKAYGPAHRGYGVANTVDTRFGIASGTKGLTALTVVSLIEEGLLALTTTARSVLGRDLQSIGGDVTVEHLLAHRSGIGDYLDEGSAGDIDEYVLTVPVHELSSTEHYLQVLDGHEPVFDPGERFSYNNSGYVVLALIAERTAGIPFPALVDQRVCQRAGMANTAFVRSDEWGDAAVGYLGADGMRTNALHLAVMGSGDGGMASTAADIHAMWDAFFAGRIVGAEWVAEMVRSRSDVPAESMRYGLGCWLHESDDAVVLEGYDAGVSFRTVCDPARRSVHTVLSNTSEGAWPIARHLDTDQQGREIL